MRRMIAKSITTQISKPSLFHWTNSFFLKLPQQLIQAPSSNISKYFCLTECLTNLNLRYLNSKAAKRRSVSSILGKLVKLAQPYQSSLVLHENNTEEEKEEAEFEEEYLVKCACVAMLFLLLHFFLIFNEKKGLLISLILNYSLQLSFIREIEIERVLLKTLSDKAQYND